MVQHLHNNLVLSKARKFRGGGAVPLVIVSNINGGVGDHLAAHPVAVTVIEEVGIDRSPRGIDQTV